MKYTTLKYQASIILFLLLIFALSIQIYAQTNVSGPVSGTWTKAGSPYIITGNITVASGQTLTIAAGVEVRSSNYRDVITINGTLIAKGTSADSIRFNGFANPGNSNSTHGGSLWFSSSAISSQLEYVSINRWGDINYQSDFYGAVFIGSSGVSITKCTIKNSENFGIRTANSSISPIIQDNNFVNNPNDIGTYISTASRITANRNANINLLSGDSKQNGILNKQGINSCFKLDNNSVTISEGDTIEIKPGVKIHSMYYNDKITINGTLIAKGVVADSIKFVGFARTDDSISTHGGRIRFESTSINSQLEYISIDRWGDNYGINNYYGAIYINSSGVSITNSTIKNSENFGIMTGFRSISPLIKDNTFVNNPNAIGTYIYTASRITSNRNANINLLSGDSKQNGILNKQGTNSYYKLDNNSVIINQGHTIEIKPGVEIRSMHYNDNITIKGTLIAKGTAVDSIRFIGFARIGDTTSTHGGSLRFESMAISSQLEYVSINRWGNGDNFYGDSHGAVYINSSGVSITKSTIINSKNYGIRIEDNSISPLIKDNSFINNPNAIGTYISSSSGIISNRNANIHLLSGYSQQNGILNKQGINSYFNLNNNFVAINEGDTIEIKPGVEIRSMYYEDNISIYGTLIARGTATDSIRFIGFARANDIYSTHGGTLNFQSESINSKLEYVSIDRWGGNNYTSGYAIAISIYTSSLSISKCIIKNSEYNGIYLGNSTVSPSIQNNKFVNNPVDISAYVQNCVAILNNINAKIQLNSSYLSTNAYLPFAGTGSYYILFGQMWVGETSTLTIEAGNLIDPGYGYLDVAGTLKVLGTELTPIQFINSKNSYSSSIYLKASSTNSIITYAYFNNSWYAPSLRLETNSFSISNITVSNAINEGVYYSATGSASISSSNFFNNKTGVYVDKGKLTLYNCNIYDNTDFGVNNVSSAVADTVDARNSYWGDPSGPLHPVLNPGGSGNRVSNKVKFMPVRPLPQNGQIIDIGVSAVLSPVTDCNLTDTTAIKVRINNYGNSSQGNFQVSYKLNNQAVVTETVTGATLLAGRTFDYTFTTKANLRTLGNYNLTVFTKLALDTLRTNDTLKTTLTHLPNLAAPTSLLPANNATDIDASIPFSWSAIPNASYDLYIWKSSDPIPTTPSISNITQIAYVLPFNSLAYGVQYKWKVVAKRVSCKAESVVNTFTTRQLPDVIVESITVPPTATSETDITINFKIKNQGTGGTKTGTWRDGVYLCDRPTLYEGVENIYINSIPNLSALTPGQSYQAQNFTFRLPQGIQGNYYIIVQANASQSLVESIQTNNTKASNAINVSLIPPPDLQVPSVVTSTLNAFSEDSLRVTYKVKNSGTGPTTATFWTDYVYLTKDDVLNLNTATFLSSFKRTQRLANSAEYTAIARTKLPARINGTYYVHIVSDVYNDVYEYNKENNNTGRSLPITITQKPTPDLTARQLTVAADSVSYNQPVIIQWTTANEGAIAAQPSWQDYIYLSGNTAFNEESSQFIDTFYETLAINSLNSRSNQHTIIIPPTLPEGNYYFFVKADGTNDIYENLEENNNVSPASSIVTIVKTDLKPITLTAPATAQSEQTITVQWKVKNDSRGNIINNSWTDKVYLSSNNTFESGVDILLGSATLNQLLMKGGEYTKQISATLPIGISGSYYLLIVTDNNNNILEKLETNNVLSKPITLTLAPWADLQVSNIIVPTIDTAGTPITVKYTIKNGGSGNISNKSWTDYIYLSPTNNINETNLTLLGSVSHNRSLGSNQSFTQNVTFIIPSVSQRLYYVLIKTDFANNVFENTNENNNVAIATATDVKVVVIVVEPPKSIDLSMNAGQVLSPTVTAGQSVNIQWTVKNNSNIATASPLWTDAVYLSSNPLLDISDVLLSTKSINTPLNAGASYTQTSTVTIPESASGTLYILVVTDKDNKNNDPNRGNNALPLTSSGGGQTVVITIPPPTDLMPKSFTVPGQGNASQPVKISFTIKNQGTGITPSGNWIDQLYLSTDLTFGNDIHLGTFARNSSLAAGAEYTINEQVFLPGNIAGNYIVLLKTDANESVFERNGEENNQAFGNILINAQQPSDLVITSLNIPATEQYAGASATINWSIKNTGNNTANGFKRDAIYISKDSVIDATDVLFGISDKSTYLPPQATETNSLTGLLTNISVGEYFVMLKTDILNNIVEYNEINNETIALAKLKIRVKELPIGVVTADTLVNDAPLYYQISIPPNLANETLSITLKGDSVLNATNRLFLSFNKVPQANQYDFIAAIPFKANQEITIPALSAGIYYLSTLGSHPSKTKQNIKLLAKIIPFIITSVNSNKGGNTGSVTVKIEGAKFETGMTISLTRQSQVYTATHVYYVDQSKLFATFNLTNATVGTYTISLKKQNNSTAQLVNGFEITSGTPGGIDDPGSLFSCSIQNIGFDDNISLDILRPESVRRNQLVKITVAYANNSNVDIPVQTRMMLSLEGAPINFIPEFSKKLQELIIEFKEQNGPPEVLRAGSSGYINIYSSAIAPLSFIITK